MNERTKKYLRWAGAGLCVFMAVSNLIPISLIGSGLIDGSVSVDDKAHFEMTLFIYCAEVVALSALAFYLVKYRKKE